MDEQHRFSERWPETKQNFCITKWGYGKLKEGNAVNKFTKRLLKYKKRF